MNVSALPTINAVLNGISAILLLWGFVQIKRGNRAKHHRLMIGALISSVLFLISYLMYHYAVGSVPYPRHDWTRLLYFVILIPHIILAGVMVPFIIAALVYALRNNFVKHVRLTRWVWPVWMFVSLSGIAIYVMLYRC